MSYVFLLFAVALLTASQIAQKVSADKVLKNDLSRRSLCRLLTCPEFWWALLSLGFGTTMWLVTLSSMEVSTAYPMLSLSFVLTVFSAKVFLKEQVSPLRWIGAGMISLGAALVALA